MEHWYGKRPADFRESRSGSGGGGGRGVLFLRSRRPARGCWCAADCRARTSSGWAAERRASSATMCLVPRGAEEGSTIEIDPGNLQLVANKPVSFRLYSSRTRTEDRAGRRGRVSAGAEQSGEPHLHAPLNAVLRFGKAGERLVPVKLGAKLTEVGTLEIWADSKESEHRWRLQFELRKAAAGAGVARPAAVISEEALAAAEALIPAAFVDDDDGARAVAGAAGTGAGAGAEFVAGVGDSQAGATGCWSWRRVASGARRMSSAG